MCTLQVNACGRVQEHELVVDIATMEDATMMCVRTLVCSRTWLAIAKTFSVPSREVKAFTDLNKDLMPVDVSESHFCASILSKGPLKNASLPFTHAAAWAQRMLYGSHSLFMLAINE